jgi:flagellar hook-length control protein FliK
MITQANSLLLLSPSPTTPEAMPSQSPLEDNLFRQLLAQLQDILEATPPSQEGQPSPLPVFTWQSLERRLDSLGGVAEKHLQDTLSRLDSAQDEEERRALESLLESLHNILQSLAVNTAPTGPPMPATETAAPENMSAQSPAGDIVAWSRETHSPSPSAQLPTTNQESSPGPFAERPEAPTSPQPPNANQSPAAALSEELRGASASEDQTLEYIPAFASSATQSPHQPSHLRQQGRAASATGTASQLTSPLAEISDQPGSDITFTEPGHLQASVLSGDVRSASAHTWDVSAPQGISPLLPETAAKLLGHPLPRNTILLQLEPPELGHLQVQIHLTDERLAATFWADSPEVRTLLHTHFPALNQSLQDKGFQAHQISITMGAESFAGQNGQSSQQHPEFQFLAHGREQNAPPAQERGNRSDATGSHSHHVTHARLVDVVI